MYRPFTMCGTIFTFYSEYEILTLFQFETDQLTDLHNYPTSEGRAIIQAN